MSAARTNNASKCSVRRFTGVRSFRKGTLISQKLAHFTAIRSFYTVTLIGFDSEMFGYSGQVGHGFGGLDELFQGGHDFFAGKQAAEEVDFVTEFFVGNGLDEFFGGGAGYGVEFCDLSGGSQGDLAGFAFSGELRDETDSLGACGVDAAAGEQQIADEGVSEIALQA